MFIEKYEQIGHKYQVDLTQIIEKEKERKAKVCTETEK